MIAHTKRTLDVHLANPKLTSLFDNSYVLNENPSDHFPTVSTYNIDKPIESHKKFNWQKYKNHIFYDSDDLDKNITNKIDLEKNIDKIIQQIQAAYKESIYVNKHIATNHHKSDKRKAKVRKKRKQTEKKRRKTQPNTKQYAKRSIY